MLFPTVTKNIFAKDEEFFATPERKKGSTSFKDFFHYIKA